MKRQRQVVKVRKLRIGRPVWGIEERSAEDLMRGAISGTQV